MMDDKGRKGDNVIGHLTSGEIVIPKALAQDKDFRSVLAKYMSDNGADINKFTVGSGKNSVNPETGNIEFGWNPFRYTKKALKAFKKVFSPSAPKIPKAPPPPDPAVTVVRSDDTGSMTDTQAVSGVGVSKAFLTGSLTPSSRGKKKFLG